MKHKDSFLAIESSEEINLHKSNTFIFKRNYKRIISTWEEVKRNLYLETENSAYPGVDTK